MAQHELEGSGVFTQSRLEATQPSKNMLALASNLLCSQTTPGEHHMGTLKDKFTTLSETSSSC